MQSFIKPNTFLYALITILYSLIFWIIKPQDPAVFFLMLVSVMIMVIRIRFQCLTQFLVIELVLYIATSFYYSETAYLLIPSLTLWLYKGIYFVLGAYLFNWFFVIDFSYDYLVLSMFSILTSTIVYFWLIDNKTATKDNDQLRVEKYALEKESYHLLQTQEEISELSMISERDRIAQKLHDDLGHELTGALLALRAYEVQIESSLSNESFRALKSRLENAVDNLKETVHHTKPDELFNLEYFKKRVYELKEYHINYVQKGNVSALRVTHWHALLSVIKEAYTNIQKHSNATEIDVLLYADDQVVRLSVSNNNILDKKSKSGVGLHFMRRRIEALGGTLIVNSNYLFTLSCLIPIQLEE